MKDQPKAMASIGEVLVRLVSTLVTASSDIICENNKDELLATEARLYDLLAKKLAHKHKLTKALARRLGRPPKQKRGKS